MVSSINLFIEKITSKNKLVLIFLFCITLFAYGNILFGDFVFDDNTFIQHNTQIRSLSNVNMIYSSSTTAGAGLVNDNFYRPNQQFIYAVIYSIFGLSPFVFHLVPILFHILNGFLIFILFYKLGISRRSSLFGSLLFLLHPVLTEGVSYISGLSEPLVTTTILSTILIFIEIIRGTARTNTQNKFTKWLFLGSIVFLIGLFSKENQLISLGLMFCIFIWEYKKNNNALQFFRGFIFLGILSILASLYIYSRLTILNFTGVFGLTAEVSNYSEHLYIRLFTFIHILPEYFKMIVFPWHLNYEKPYIAFPSLFNIQSIFSVITIILGISIITISIIKKNLPTLSSISLGFSWFIVALMPVSGIIPINAIYLEHFLYLPIIGIIFCLCVIIDKMQNSNHNHKEKILYALVIILTLFTIRIMLRNMEWGDPVKFYKNEIKYENIYHMQSARIYNNLAMEQADRGDCSTAILNYQKAISLNDTYPQTHHNLARCLENTGKLKEAADEYFKALYIQPNFLYSLDAISKLLAAVGDKRSIKFSELELRAQNNGKVTREDLLQASK